MRLAKFAYSFLLNETCSSMIINIKINSKA